MDKIRATTIIFSCSCTALHLSKKSSRTYHRCLISPIDDSSWTHKSPHHLRSGWFWHVYIIWERASLPPVLILNPWSNAFKMTQGFPNTSMNVNITVTYFVTAAHWCYCCRYCWCRCNFCHCNCYCYCIHGLLLLLRYRRNYCCYVIAIASAVIAAVAVLVRLFPRILFVIVYSIHCVRSWRCNCV